MKIRLSKQLFFAVDLITRSIGVFGHKGSGKTNTGGLLFEQMYAAGAQCVVLDIVGNWWSLRVRGTGPGLKITVFGGKHGDIPISANGGKLLAQIIVRKTLSCVIDLSRFQPHERKQFAADFAAELFFLKQEVPTPLHLFLEEARKFAPQHQTSKLDVQLLAAFDDIVRLGRNYGIGSTLLDQRPESVNKELTSQTEVLIVHRLLDKEARKYIEGWVRRKKKAKGAGADAFDLIDCLKTGHALVWAPEIFQDQNVKDVAIDKKATFDASKTPELEVKGRKRRSAKLAHLSAREIAKLGEAMKEVVAEATANDPVLLRAELQRLRSELAAAKHAKVKIQIKEISVLTNKDRALLTKMIGRLHNDVGALSQSIRELDVQRDRLAQSQQVIVSTLGSFTTMIERAGAVPAGPVSGRFPSSAPPKAAPPQSMEKQRTASKQPPAKPRAHAAHKDDYPGDWAPPLDPVDPGLTTPEKRVLDALAWLASIGVTPAQSAPVAFLAGYSVNSSSFGNTKSSLKTKGLITYPSGGTIALTPAGRARAAFPTETLTTAMLHAKIKEKLPSPAWKLLEPLIANRREMSHHELASRAGYSESSSSFGNARSLLHSLGLVTYPIAGTTRVADLLFID